MIATQNLSRLPVRSPEPRSATPTSFDFSHAPQVFRTYCGGALNGVPPDISRLRYEVYCLECAFLHPDAYGEGLEHDHYDGQATHFAAYTAEDRLVGAVRLVQPKNGDCYPFQRHCQPFEGYQLPPAEESAEISRLVVRKGHRRRRADSLQGVPGRGTDAPPSRPGNEHWRSGEDRRGEERDSPMLLFGLYREMYRHSLQSGIRYWYAAMERSLARSLQRLGFAFQAIGPQSDYYGAVTPCLLDLRALERRLTEANPALAAWFMEKPFVRTV
ncbi:PEP-CTERM/exosortase system-associated acyltransferase [[Empedobacter] haloabium]|uniref:PEP-CTERM/exosortase system-associated acyltransferase n=1 Tax=[Empedobacter] haloabium TaxID=592317 RepID=A0ABZ1UN57_9BURK|nr:PEP-CTERM/exosortase system-associated acyltransferase [Massilia sp. YMA4]